MTISFFVLLAASGISPNYRTLFSRDDYPKLAADRGAQGSVQVQILINPEGQVDTCTVLQSSGYAELDQQTCRIIQTRARFIPARDGDGRTIFSVDRVPVTWVLGGTPTIKINPDFDLRINHGPTGVHLPLEFKVSYFVTVVGTVADCHASEPDSPRELVDVACKVIGATPFDAIRDHNGKPVRTLDYATVRFRIKH